MNRKLYLRQQLPLLLLNLLCMAGLSLFLAATGNGKGSILLILTVWAAILSGYLLKTGYDREAQLNAMLTRAEDLDEKYLIAGLLDAPKRADDQVYLQILQTAQQAMLTKIADAQQESGEYREYLERWVHDLQAPFTAIRQLCEGSRTGLAESILPELEKACRCTEQALCYAHGRQDEEGFSLRELPVREVIRQAVAQNQHLLRQSGMAVELPESEATVYCDEKWLCFILSQLIANAIGHRGEEPRLRFSVNWQEGMLQLCIADNGIGFSKQELPYIFERGFTGKNGGQAVGLGLYLCKRLCDRLGIGIQAASDDGGTTFSLSFAIHDFSQLIKP